MRELRVGLLARPALLVFAVHFHLHHEFHGAPIGYVGLAAAAAASWLGLPGPGEPVLIAAAIFAAHNRLDIGGVILTAWASAAGGGLVGWLLGLKAGRVVLTAPGPLLRQRKAAVARGDEIFSRFPVTAILLTPSWIAGIHGVRAKIYLPVNVLGAVAWSVGIGLSSYYIGPAVIDVVGDLGLATGVGLGLLVALAVVLEVRRRRRRARTGAGAGEVPAKGARVAKARSAEDPGQAAPAAEEPGQG